MKKSLYLAIIILISSISLFSTTSSFAATTSSSTDYRNGSDIQSDNASATTSSSVDYRNGSDIQSDNASAASATANKTNTTNTSTDTNNVLGIESGKLRSGNVDMNTIPTVILSIIKTLLGIAGTVAIFSLIYHAVQMQLNSGITGDSSGVDKAKKGMTGALIGFVIAIAAWFLVTRAVDLLAAVS